MTRRANGESVVVTKTVRLVVPFIATYGLFVAFHGTGSVGGGFQGGVVLASAFVTIAFGFGIEATWAWLRRSLLLPLAIAGVGGFTVVALGSLAFGGAILELGSFPVAKAVVYGIEVVELAIAATVTATAVVLFFALARGVESPDGGRR